MVFFFLFFPAIIPCLVQHSPLSDGSYRSKNRLSEPICSLSPACMAEPTGDCFRKGYCIKGLYLCEAQRQIYFSAQSVASTSLFGLCQLLMRFWRLDGLVHDIVSDALGSSAASSHFSACKSINKLRFEEETPQKPPKNVLLTFAARS